MNYNLSEITDLIKARRSVAPEYFSDRKVHREQVDLILNNAIWAPTHGLTQPWKFHVFLNEGIRNLSSLLKNGYFEMYGSEDEKPQKLEKLQARLEKTSCVVGVVLDRSENSKIKEWEELAAVSCAIQNMLLTATAYGLSSFWSTPKFMNTPSIKSGLNLHENQKLVGLVYFGYSKEDRPIKHRKPLEYVTTWHD